MKNLNILQKGSITSTLAGCMLAFSLALTANASENAKDEKPPIWDTNTVILEHHELAPNVYAVYQKDAENLTAKGVPLATSGGFIIGDKGVMMIETMMTERLTNQVLDMIKSLTDKPIIYAINTSSHGDHANGNYLLPAETQIIQHAATKKYIEENFDKDIKFMIEHFGKGRGLENVVARTGTIIIPENGEKVIDLGNIQVLVKDFGFAQTGGDLFVWLPESKILWTGNPIISAAPSLPWLLDGHLDATLTTLKKLYEFIPEDAKVIPGHGATTDRSSIKWNIDYLQAVKDGVTKAISQGKSLEDTVKSLPMDNYKGYALFNWVHFELNIPAAYKDVSENNKKSTK